MSMTICPDCDGDGQSFMHVHTADPTTHGFQYTPCSICKGRGKIHELYLAAIERGKVQREERISRNKSLREEAERRGISVKQLCDEEHGRHDPEINSPAFHDDCGDR